MPPKLNIGKQANDNLDPDEPWRRAELLIEAHAEISGSKNHPYDAPAPAIRALLVDLMHYCEVQNIGKDKGAADYLDFDSVLKQARSDFQVQSKMMNSVIDKAAETASERVRDHTAERMAAAEAHHAGLQRQAIYNLIPTISDMPKDLVAKAAPENDPKLANLLTALQQRQIQEADKFLKGLESEAPDPLRHEQAYDAQARKFREEMERYLRQYTKGRERAEDRKPGFNLEE